MTTVSHPRPSAGVAAIVTQAKRLLDTMPAAAPFLTEWPRSLGLRATTVQGCPVLTWLGEVATRTTLATAPLVEAIAAAANTLNWRQSYTAADFGASFLARYGWTELIGPKGPVSSTTLACGVLMLGPGVEYPAHAHEAVELYVPLSGTALWTCGRESAVRRPPGQPIHHASWLPHAMRTETEALLALYLWRDGDLSAKPAIIG